MNRCVTLLALSLGFGTVLFAQEQVPPLLRDATRCLAAKTFKIPSSHGLGYLVDTKSWPGEKVLYVVAYTGQSRSEGYVYTIFLSQNAHRQIFNIQNNAKFVVNKRVPDGVDFVEAPLGGIWTQNHLVTAIKQIGRQLSLSLPASDLREPSSSAVCESYADPK